MYVNMWLACLCDFQERLTVGRKPESVADMIPEGEIILTINVYYPAVIDKVSFHLRRGARNPPDLIVFTRHFLSLKVLSMLQTFTSHFPSV